MSVSQKTTVPENGRTDGQMEVRLAREGEREREKADVVAGVGVGVVRWLSGSGGRLVVVRSSASRR